MTKNHRIAAVLVAAGQGLRFMADQPKQYLMLHDRPILRHAAEAFLGHPAIGRVQVVIGDDHHALYQAAVGDLSLPAPVIGGATRQESVLHGLESLSAWQPDLVLIHDAARPLIGDETIDALLAALDTSTGAIVAVPVADTLKRADQQQHIAATVPREGLWQAQTPQAFRYAEILAAHRRLAGAELTDDAALAEAAGWPVALVEARSPNFKITRRNDLIMAEALMAGHAQAVASADSDIAKGVHAVPPMMETRTGLGFDVHRLVPGDGVILCNVVIPSPMKLDGHSDADVALHAVTDALLGAMCAGDIGQHFPPSDPQWRGADSAQFLEHAVVMLKQRGGRLVHTDVTIMCEQPKIGPHRDRLQARLGEILGVSAGRASVKATTTERLGFAGRGEGIACQAVVTIELPRTDG